MAVAKSSLRLAELKLVVWISSRTPLGPSDIHILRMPKRGRPGEVKVPSAWRREIFSSSVRRGRRSLARWSGVRDLLRHGAEASPMSGAATAGDAGGVGA